ncbi:hypothetical protein ABXN37_26435 [Piscinibacter sakaiensis]|uniref:InlB B-repeat-containing protein n=1 Tax=Piscinibacter sakaiensis TaxID=1547922 RepID=UPI00372AD00D
MKAWRIALLSVAVWLSACGGGGSVGEGPVAGTAAVGAAAPGTDVRDAQGNPLVGTTPSGVTFSMPLWRTICARLTFFSTVLQREICDTVAGVSATPQVTLRVSRFGQGEVVVDRGALACRQQDCDGIYPAGTRVAVTATAAPGWTFDHWTGCDAASGATCDVTLADNRTVQPFFVSSTTPRIKAGVVVLDAQALDQLVSVEENVLTFRNASAQLSAVAVGNILVSGRGDGFARRVLNIIALNGGNILFATAPAALTDIVEQGTVVGGAAPASGSRAVPLSLERGVTVAAARRAQDAAATTLNIDVSLDDKVRVSGSVALEWNPEVALDFGPVSGLQEFKLLLNPKVTPALTVSWTGLEIDGDKAEKIFDLGVFKLSPILIQAGPVPIVIVPTVKGFVRFSAAAGAGWSGIHSTIGSGSFSPSGTGEVQGQLGVGSVATF